MLLKEELSLRRRVSRPEGCSLTAVTHHYALHLKTVGDVIPRLSVCGGALLKGGATSHIHGFTIVRPWRGGRFVHSGHRNVCGMR